jgi:hypothetical protein
VIAEITNLVIKPNTSMLRSIFAISVILLQLLFDLLETRSELSMLRLRWLLPNFLHLHDKLLLLRLFLIQLDFQALIRTLKITLQLR